jgi:hypothetical protein
LPLQIFSSHTFSHPAQVCGSHRWCSPYLGRQATWHWICSICDSLQHL